jgi:hypothetical protein
MIIGTEGDTIELEGGHPDQDLALTPCDIEGGFAKYMTRVQTHKVHQTTAATRYTEAAKFTASLS